MKISVFTPTYNRAYTLGNLYESLRKQTCLDFEWIIVDDGSEDNTQTLCESFRADLFPVRYYRTDNRGKHCAINFGARMAEGDWFYIVDSDDLLPANAIELLIAEEKHIKSPRVGVLSGMRYYSSGKVIARDITFDRLECTALDFRQKLRVHGDVAEAIKTSVIREFPFPEYEGERFCPEDVMFNRIAQKYLTHYFKANIYECEYLPDGLTAHITAIRMKSWKGTCLCYSELASSPVPLYAKVRASINYWRFRACQKKTDNAIPQYILPPWAFLLRPAGLLFHLKDLWT